MAPRITAIIKVSVQRGTRTGIGETTESSAVTCAVGTATYSCDTANTDAVTVASGSTDADDYPGDASNRTDVYDTADAEARTVAHDTDDGDGATPRCTRTTPTAAVTKLCGQAWPERELDGELQRPRQLETAPGQDPDRAEAALVTILEMEGSCCKIWGDRG